MDLQKRYNIAYKALKSGIYDYEFRVDGSLFADYENTDITAADCEVKVRMERAERMLILDVAIRGTVTVPCDRCLEDCPIEIDYTGRLTVRFSDEPAEYDGEVLWLHPSEEEVDLTQYIYESIVLALPYRRVHAEGQCNPEMLERFRIVSSDEFDAIEAEAEEENESLPETQRQQLEALKQQMMTNENKG